MANNNPTHVVTGKVRMSYEHILKPYKGTNAGPDDAPKYSVTVLVPKTDTATRAKLDAAILAAKKRGVDTKKYKDGTPIDRLPTPIYDGDGYRADGYTPFGPECKGMWVFTASCGQDRRPGVVDASCQPILDPSEIYSGIWGRVAVDFFPYSFAGKQGVGCSLVNVQKLADGEPLGATRATAEDDFGGDDFDPLA
jgi:hypothetical protein